MIRFLCFFIKKKRVSIWSLYCNPKYLWIIRTLFINHTSTVWAFFIKGFGSKATHINICTLIFKLCINLIFKATQCCLFNTGSRHGLFHHSSATDPKEKKQQPRIIIEGWWCLLERQTPAKAFALTTWLSFNTRSIPPYWPVKSLTTLLTLFLKGLISARRHVIYSFMH